MGFLVTNQSHGYAAYKFVFSDPMCVGHLGTNCQHPANSLQLRVLSRLLNSLSSALIEMKRKGSSGEQADVKGTKRRRREKKSESDSFAKKSEHIAKKAVENLDTKLDLSDAQSMIKSVLTPHSVGAFKDEYWEKKPLHIKRNDKSFYGNILNKESMMKLLEECTLNYEIDLNAWKYVDGEKASLNGDDVAKAKEVREIFEKTNGVIQFHQPQRFSASLWKIMELLENYFGSLVGANVTMTPKAVMGLPLQNNDMEDFILQLEGKQKWILYDATEKLSREFNPLLDRDEIGEKLLEVNMEPGDLLYYPRGTIFEATALADGHSTHLTLSTYHSNSWGDFILEGISTCVEAAMANEIELRKGLPFDYLKKLGTCKFLDDYVDDDDDEEMNGKETNDKRSKKPKVEKSPRKVSVEVMEKFKSKVKDLLCRAVDHFDPNTVTDSRSEEFMANRLPPFDKHDEDELLKEPTEQSSIKILYPDHLRLIVYDDDDDDEFDADAADETDEEDIVGDDDDMEEDEEDDGEEEEKDEKPRANKSKSRSHKEENGKGKQKEKTKEKKKIKGSKNEDEDMDGEDIEKEEEDSLQGPHMRLLFSVHNPREAHMIGGLQEPNAVKLALHFAKPVKYLLDHCNEFIPLNDLPLEDGSDKLELAKTLWTEKLICVD